MESGKEKKKQTQQRAKEGEWWNMKNIEKMINDRGKQNQRNRFWEQEWQLGMRSTCEHLVPSIFDLAVTEEAPEMGGNWEVDCKALRCSMPRFGQVARCQCPSPIHQWSDGFEHRARFEKKTVRKKKQATVNSNSSCPTVEWRLGLVAVFAVAANVVLSSVTAQALYEYACRRSPKVSTSNFQTALNSARQQGKRAYMCKL